MQKRHPKLFFGLALLLSAFACSQQYVSYSLNPIQSATSFKLDAPYELVWEALQEVLSTYPILYANQENGIITTDYILSYSYDNMLLSQSANVSKFGYFAYSLPDYSNYSIVVITEPGSQAYQHLLPGDIILNYEKDKISRSLSYDFIVYRNNEIIKINLTKANFKSKFDRSIVLQGRLRINIRVNKVAPNESNLLLSFLEEQRNARYKPSANAINIDEMATLDEHGYKKTLFMKILNDTIEKLRNGSEKS